MTLMTNFSPKATGTDETHGGGAVHLYKAVVSIGSTAFIGNVGVRGGAVHVREAAAISLLEATFAENSADYGGALYCRASNLILGNSIVAFGQGEAVTCVDPLDVVVSCTDVFGNTGGDWTGCIAVLYGGPAVLRRKRPVRSLHAVRYFPVCLSEQPLRADGQVGRGLFRDAGRGPQLGRNQGDVSIGPACARLSHERPLNRALISC